MSGGYGEFARVYDRLTFNVPYDLLAERYAERLAVLGVRGGRLLDMGCGTGSLTVRLAERGYDVIGQDASPEMLSVAAGKSSEVLWICQDMRSIDLGGTVNAVVSTLDSVNHLESASAMLECFRGAADCLESGGAFVFDVNTVRKHREILGNNTFVYDVDGVYCVWSNFLDESDNGVDIELDLFLENEDGTYTRVEESFREIALPNEEYTRLLNKAGFEVVNVLDYDTYNNVTDSAEKLLISARKR